VSGKKTSVNKTKKKMFTSGEGPAGGRVHALEKKLQTGKPPRRMASSSRHSGSGGSRNKSGKENLLKKWENWELTGGLFHKNQ